METNTTHFESRIPPLCGRCGGRTDGKVSAPSVKGFGALISCDCPTEQPTRASAPVLDSVRIDAALQAAVDGHIREQLTLAKWQLSKGLRLRNTALGAMHLQAAQLIVDGLLGVG